MLLDMIRRGVSLQEIFISVFVSAFFVLAILPVHEWAHAFAANRLGDSTARHMGRLTLNPIAHIDPLGAACIFLFGFGWAKPVPVNIYNFEIRKRKLYFGLTAFAGPLSNLIFAFIGAAVWRILIVFATSFSPMLFVYLKWVFVLFVRINLTIAVFNLVPVPPLDGSRIAAIFLPDRIYYKMLEYERYIFIVVMALVFTGVLSNIIYALSAGILNIFQTILFYPNLDVFLL